MQRRDFLKLTALSSLPLMAPRMVLSGTPSLSRDILVCLYLRGGADGLNIVAPVGDSRYYDLRPTLAVAEPGGPGGAIDLDGFFGMHPAMEPLASAFGAGELAFVHAAGSPSDTRSHFDAQDMMEAGVDVKGYAFDGWLNRHLAGLTDFEAKTFSAVGLGPSLPLSLRGDIPALGLNDLNAFQVITPRTETARFEQALGKLYGGDSTLDLQGQAVFGAVDTLADAGITDSQPANGALYPQGGLGVQLASVAAMVRADLGLEVACVDFGGWDHHDNLAPQMDSLAGELAQALAAFRQDLGPDFGRVTVVAMTEFGRRAQENASSGTDHGHASLMLAYGGNVNGGSVFGQWPGLGAADLNRGDLEVTTDFRTVLSEVLGKRRGQTALESVFPEFAGPVDMGLFSAA